MIGYLDSSALVKRYIREKGTDSVTRWLEEQVIATSCLSRIEITSAVCRRQREGCFSEDKRDEVLGALEADCEAWTLVEVGPEVLDRAVDLLGRRQLRGADAVQLASALFLWEAAGAEVKFGGFDQRLNDAAREEGLSLLF